MERKTRVNVTLEKFKCVKILIESGAIYDEIVSMTGVSKANINRIKNAESYEEYKHNIRTAAIAYSAKKKQAEKEAERLLEAQIKRQEDEARQAEDERQREEAAKRDKSVQHTAGSYYQMNRVIELLKEQNDILKILSNKVAFIVDELTK